MVVWPVRFELTTPCSQSRCATKLRYGQSGPPYCPVAREVDHRPGSYQHGRHESLGDVVLTTQQLHIRRLRAADAGRRRRSYLVRPRCGPVPDLGSAVHPILAGIGPRRRPRR